MALNLEVPIEMVDYGLASSSAAAIIFNRSKIHFNPANYDGVTGVYFEISGYNVNITTDYIIDLYDVTDSDIKTSITVPKSTTSMTRLRSAAWTPDNANHIYAVQLRQTTANSDLGVFSARIIVVQVNATITRIQIPLLQVAGGWSNVNDNTIYVDTHNSIIYGQNLVSYYSWYLKDTAFLADIAGWSFETVLASNNTSKTAYAILHNVTDNTTIAESEISITGTTVALVESAEFANNVSNFHENDIFDIQIKATAGYIVYIGRASLYVRLTNLTKAEVIWRVGEAGNFVTDINYVHCRALLNTSGYSSPVIYFETTGLSSANNDVAYLYDNLTNDVGTDGSNVADSGLTYIQTNKTRQRTAALTITGGDRFYNFIDRVSGTIRPTSAWVIIRCSDLSTGNAIFFGTNF